MRLAKSLPGGALSYPELGPGRGSVADYFAEVHHPGPAEGRQHRIVKSGAGGNVRALDREVVYHVLIMAERRLGVHAGRPEGRDRRSVGGLRLGPGCRPRATRGFGFS